MTNEKLILCDLDGTLANLDHRLQYVRTTPKNWPAFNAAIPHDTLIEPVAMIIRHFLMDTDHRVVYLSGRSEDTRKVTAQWLVENDLYNSFGLYMRKAGDYRKDDIVKEELLDQVMSDYPNNPVAFVIDDRPQVVRMWHRRGIFCFNVAQGFKEF